MNVDIKEYNDFLTAEQCSLFIMAALPNLISYYDSDDDSSKYRFAAGYFLERKYALSNHLNLNTLIKKINFEYANLRKKVEEISGFPENNQEAANIIRYGTGGEYKKHKDASSPEDLKYDEYPHAGSRKKTCLIYLNDNFEGGETHFPELNVKIKPRLGKAVVWNNVHEDNSLIEESVHAGLPVLSNSKWIVSIWIREKSFFKESPPVKTVPHE